jgi:hypothetical protein
MLAEANVACISYMNWGDTSRASDVGNQIAQVLLT